MLQIKDQFRSINLNRKPYFNQLLESHNLNLMEVELLVFLSEQPDSNTFTQIMQAKDYAKSHISNAINCLCERGYLEKRAVSSNKKIFQLFLLEKSGPVIEEYYLCNQQFELDAFAGIDQGDMALFHQVVHRINQNLSKD